MVKTDGMLGSRDHATCVRPAPTSETDNVTIKPHSRFQTPRLQALFAASVLAVGLFLTATTADATAVLAGSVGGVPTGADHYENFDTLALRGVHPGRPGGAGRRERAVRGAIPVEQQWHPVRRPEQRRGCNHLSHQRV